MRKGLLTATKDCGGDPKSIIRGVVHLKNIILKSRLTDGEGEGKVKIIIRGVVNGEGSHVQGGISKCWLLEA